MDKGFHPLVLFWVAFYNDETVLPQFDFETGKENSFRDIDQSRLIKFGLFPFPEELANKIGEFANRKENFPFFILELKEGQRLIYYRRNAIHEYTYQNCKKCGYEWQWMPNNPKKVGEAGLPIHWDYILEEHEGKKYPTAQCPKCKSYNAIKCPDCKILISEFEREDKSRFFQCSKCKKEYPRFISVSASVKREIVYLLGNQQTIDEKNKKHILYIKENGTFELGDE